MADTSPLADTTPDRDLLHQPSKLENLPYDIKYLILQSISDHGTLVKFSQASRVFYNIFREHRHALFQYLMFNEASEYMEESYLLACLGDQLSNSTMTVAYLDNLYQCYADSLSPTAFEHPWYYREVLRGGASMRAKISECHKGIKEHCDQFIRRELRPKMKLRPLKEDGTDHDELPPTDSERRRIMQALYKIWLLLKLHHVKVADPEEFAPASRNIGTPTYLLRADVARYLKLWDYWDLKVVQVLLPIFWNDMKTKYDKRGDSLIREALSNHEGDRHDDYTYFTLFLNTTLHLYFPHTGLKWFNTSSNETEIHQHIKNVSNYLSDKQNRAHFESLGDFTGIAYIYFQQVHGSPSNMNGFPGPEVFDNVPLKRLGRPGRAMNEYSGRGLDGKRRFLKCLNHASLAHSDLQSCMWDDWRLESWGYVTPDFTSELTDQDPLPTTAIEGQLESFTL
ncbi:hypothetical protein TWF102_000794 [Orbilia oligospora]|uniref:F-box domain-containing protein n=1 Tax=Orbilia oligospora TaxID=2813651 RepID=A0A7C8N4V9_ORBOL|nr:hypothetical protein TWF102_000794 [Orbilia oligospora]KAF3116572.1 hypothetical protein TWF103_008335 [Orbilia oligospora]